MRAWELASVVFFAYVAVVAALPRGLAPRRRRRALAGSAVGLATAFATHAVPYNWILHGWIAPPLLLLLGYWTSGRLFVAPMPRAESLLWRIDARLRIDRVAARTPRAAAEFLELAYTGVYLLIPLALYLVLAIGVVADRAWTVVLVTDFICFGCLPWIQTRPPRAFVADVPWRSRWRGVNVRLLSATSIQVNTFPSGHAAEALVAALLVIGASRTVSAWMFFNTAAISAGAVLGRYHYAADAIAGWIVAVVVWWLLG